MDKIIIIFCQNKKCLWNKTKVFYTSKRIVRNECNRGGLIRIGKEGYCESFEILPPSTKSAPVVDENEGKSGG